MSKKRESSEKKHILEKTHGNYSKSESFHLISVGNGGEDENDNW